MNARAIPKKSVRAQLAMFLTNARSLDHVTAVDLSRRYRLPLPELQRAFAVEQQRRGRMI